MTARILSIGIGEVHRLAFGRGPVGRAMTDPAIRSLRVCLILISTVYGGSKTVALTARRGNVACIPIKTANVTVAVVAIGIEILASEGGLNHA
jgi:hypothetical protein